MWVYLVIIVIMILKVIHKATMFLTKGVRGVVAKRLRSSTCKLSTSHRMGVYVCGDLSADLCCVGGSNMRNFRYSYMWGLPPPVKA